MKLIALAVLSFISIIIVEISFLGVWPGLFISHIIFLFVLNSINSKNTRWKVSLLYIVIFYSIKKLAFTNGALFALNNLLQSPFKSISIYSIAFIYELIIVLVFSVLIVKSYRCKTLRFRVPLLIIGLVGISILSNPWIPFDVVLPLSQNLWLLSSIKTLSNFGITLWFHSFCILVFILMSSKRKPTLYSRLALLLFFASPFLIGSLNQNKSSSDQLYGKQVYLFQTNESNLTNEIKPTNWNQIIERISKLPISTEPLLIFPEYALRKNDPILKKLRSAILERFSRYDLFIGVEEIISNQIENKIYHYNESKLINFYEKREAFPIGELPIDLPFIPKAWLTPLAQVKKSSSKPAVFTIDTFQFLPLICYEATFAEEYIRVKKQANKDSNQIFINFSKDSFFQNTNILDWWNVFARLNASNNETRLIRISTNNYTTYIESDGRVKLIAQKDKFIILNFEI